MRRRIIERGIDKKGEILERNNKERDDVEWERRAVNNDGELGRVNRGQGDNILSDKTRMISWRKHSRERDNRPR
jgi:hypothetical protein